MHSLVRRILPVALLLATGCGGHTPPAARPSGVAATQSVVLVSLDAFRWDYLQRPNAVNLRRLAAEGVHAERMIPSFPSSTFPNHYTIATGLYPEHHGIVSNTVFDSTLGMFRMSDTLAVRNPKWWGGEPMWTTAEKQGVKAGAFFWPGSEANEGGIVPTRTMIFDDKFPNAPRVDSVLKWLTLPGAQAMRLVNLYFSDVDHAGHTYGPDAPQVDSAIARVDTMIGRLMDGLAARGLSGRVNLIVVSDHGMQNRSPDRAIFIDDYITMTDVRVIETATLGQLIPNPGKFDAVYNALKGKNPHLQVYRRAEVPARFHFDDSKRIAPLVLMADTGYTIMTHAAFNRSPPTGGAHGYDNMAPTMGASFIAAGPAFKQGYTSKPFQNIHVYDLVCHILGIRPAPNDGSLDSTRMLQKSR